MCINWKQCEIAFQLVHTCKHSFCSSHRTGKGIKNFRKVTYLLNECFVFFVFFWIENIWYPSQRTALSDNFNFLSRFVFQLLCERNTKTVIFKFWDIFMENLAATINVEPARPKLNYIYIYNPCIVDINITKL